MDVGIFVLGVIEENTPQIINASLWQGSSSCIEVYGKWMPIALTFSKTSTV